MFYLCSLGSNIQPQKNITKALSALLRHFQIITLSPLVKTQPYQMQTNHIFINALLSFQSNENPQTVKSHFNQIETQLGRDRNDCHRKEKDRAIDLDIHYTGNTINMYDYLFEEPFLQQVADTVNKKNNKDKLLIFQFKNQHIGEKTVQVSAAK